MTIFHLSRPPSDTAASPLTPTVAHIATRYLRGGSERRIRDMVRAVPEAEHHLVVGGASDRQLAERQVGAASVMVVPTLVREPSPLRDLAALAQLVRTIRRRRFDLVVTHQSKAGVLGRLAARAAGVPAVHSLSMPSFGPGYGRWQSAVFRFLEARLARTTTMFAAVGIDVARRYEAIGVPRDRLRVVRSGVALTADDRTPSDEVRRRHGLPADRDLVLYLGSLEPRKHVLDLPRLLRLLVASSERSGTTPPYLVVAGEGPLATDLRTRLAADGLDASAALLGFVDDPLPLLRTADVVVLLSEAEGVPQVLVQAAAAGTPFVAYDVDGVGELVSLGADGVVIAPGDLDAAASAATDVLQRQRRPASVNIDLSPWNADQIAQDYRRLFGEVLGWGSSVDVFPGPHIRERTRAS